MARSGREVLGDAVRVIAEQAADPGQIVGRGAGGVAVHIAARVMSQAGPGEVLVSSTVRGLVTGSSLFFEDAGEHELKGVPDRWHLYRVVV